MSIARFLLLIIFAVMAPVFAVTSVTRHDETSHQFTSDIGISSGLMAKVRDVTKSLRDDAAARGAGYVSMLGCVSGPQEGAMGTHYINDTYARDGVLDVKRPEALIFDNGRLVGVEFIIPVAAWHEKHAEPPTFEGHLMHYVGSPNRYAMDPFYELHVWAWRENPHGSFADWNPRVSCDGQ